MTDRDRGRPERPTWRVLLGSWLLEGVGWFALAESLGRTIVEGFVILLLWVAGLSFALIVLAWLLYHTAAWFLLYGGHAKLRSMREGSSPLDRVHRYRDRVIEAVRRARSIRVAVLYGSAARGQMNKRSDVDLMLVPERPRIGGVMFVWGLRLASVLRRMPLEVSLMDVERYVALRQRHPTVVLKDVANPAPGSEQLASVGVLLTISGIDGSGKTTVAKEIVRTLHGQGVNATYFYGHRHFFRGGLRSLSPAVAFKAIWRRIGNSPENLRSFRAAKFLLDLLTVVDYIGVQARLGRHLRPGSVVVVDRYAVDVIVYLRSFGPGHQTVEGLLTGISFAPDVALLFEIDPSRARERKREEPLEMLTWVSQEYEKLAPVHCLTKIDANGPVSEVLSNVMRIVDAYLKGEASPVETNHPRMNRPSGIG